MASAKRSWLLQEFSAHNSAVSAVALGKKSGRVMATGGEDGHVNLWAVGNPTYITKFTGNSSSVESLAFNGTEELVCAGSRSGQLKIWNISEGKVTRNLTGHKAAVSCLDFHSIGEFVASGSLDHKVKMWDYRRKGCIFTYTGHQGAINALQFSPDGRWMASGSDDGACKIWDLSAGKLLHQFMDHGAAVTCLQFHPNELLMATGGKDRTVKVYDVEQFHLVSSCKPRTSVVEKVAFSESGHCVYSISQDNCHAYLWEPEPRTTDAFIVKWGRPSDVVIVSKQLISATFSQNLVSNYVVDLTQVRTEGFEIPNSVLPFQPPTAVTPFSRPAHITQRPQTVSGATTTKPASLSTENKKPQRQRISSPAQEKQTNFNNNKPSVEDSNDQNEAFNPRCTLNRSPSSNRPTNIGVSNEQYSRNIKHTPSPHQATNILPHLAPEPVAPFRNCHEKAERDATPQNFVPSSAKAPEWSKHIPESVPVEDIPTRDQIIPEKLESNRPVVNPPAISNGIPNPLEESRLSTMVPAQREDPVGLDMNAFLPAKKEPVNVIGKSEEKLTDDQVISSIKQGFESMRIVLKSRHKNLEIVRAMWTSGDVMTSMNTAIRMKDQALLVDMLSVLNMKQSLWNLDLCQVMLPEVHGLLTSKYEAYVTAACGALKIILRNFGQLIKTNVSAPPSSAVDLSREQRYKKCFACHESIVQVRTVLEKRLQQPGKVGSNFRELNILISSTLD